MSISPIGAVSSVQQHTPPAAVKAESNEAPGTVDHDGDAEDMAAGKAPSVKPGSVDLKA